MGKAKTKKSSAVYRHNPLEKDISETRYAQASSRTKIRSRVSNDKCVDASGLLKIVNEQQQEDLIEKHVINKGSDILDSSDLSQDYTEDSVLSDFEDDEIVQAITVINEDEEEAFKKFNSVGLQERKDLAANIREILTEKQTEICTAYSDVGSVVADGNQGIWEEVASYLKQYRSGKLPKAFKRIPEASHFESLLCLTKPDQWTSAAMCEATRIFASNLGEIRAQRYFNKILLPRCRDEIAESKTLNCHLYNAVAKAVFKPKAFFKGIIIPLCQDTYCTRREAVIFSSILAKCSIPLYHSSAALVTIARLKYQGSNSIFMRTLIEKNYALPYRAVNEIVDHFLRFMEDRREVHLVWHHCLLTFVQIYKIDLSVEQRQDLLKLLTVHHHDHVTPEIRKELQETAKLPNDIQHLWKL